jgi:hypothetical protein
MFVEVAGHHRDLRFRQRPDAEGVNEFLHPPRRNAEEVTGRDHCRQGLFGAAASFE